MPAVGPGEPVPRDRVGRGEPAVDLPVRLLEWGLIAIVLVAPLSFGSVVPGGRLLLELWVYALGLVWLARAALRSTPAPPLPTSLAVAGLLLLALLQSLPLGEGATALISSESVAIREASRPAGVALEAERGLLGSDPANLDSPAAVSLAPASTASALRTGSAYALLLLIATTVAAERGLRRLAVAMLISAAFQALYGTLILASGHDMIWHVPKRHYLDSATGTYVNRNHYAGFLAATLPAGLSLLLSAWRERREGGSSWRERVLELFGTEGNRALLLGLLLLLGLAGLLLSMSRAGIALGLLALGLTVFASRRRGMSLRAVSILLLAALSLVPLMQIGADRLAERYGETARDLTIAGGRVTVWRDTAAMWGHHPWLGIGFGAFAEAYPLYRSPSVRLFYDHAHNDALQVLAEGGLLGALLLATVLAGLLVAMARALNGRAGAIGIGLAAGFCALLLHGLIDFNFHIPANAALGAILAGALLGSTWNHPS